MTNVILWYRLNRFYKIFYPNLMVRVSLKDLSNPNVIAEALFDVAEVLVEYGNDDTPMTKWLNKLYRVLETRQ